MLGHILEAGGAGAIYGTQNGPLGVFVQKGERDQGRAASTPMPAHWGLAAWTGAGMFPHFADKMLPVTRQADAQASAQASEQVDLFACANQAGGSNLVAINKSQSEQAISIRLRSRGAGAYDLWQTNAEAPFDAPRRVRQGVAFENEIALALAAMTVAVAAQKAPAAQRRLQSSGLQPAPASTCTALCRTKHKINATCARAYASFNTIRSAMISRRELLGPCILCYV